MTENYPRRRNGSEFYSKRKKPFVKDPYFGGERYARDKDGNQLYPNSDKPFARNKKNEEYYAKDFQGNEMYPVQQGKSKIIQDNNGKFQFARMSDGTERYPQDAKENEYYLERDGKPLLLRKPNGEYYLAQNRKGYKLIPWNLLAEYAIDNEPYLFTKDVLGNNVYVRQSELPQRLSAICQCVCNILFDCPVALNALGCCLLQAY
ncbi:hypothetical protein TNCT_24251 [Trichonephila clavata]|uniref:Uncharacterized protein n=2 Tax=Trichonephila clavata TaxID=2740835 RepID=A0A8X6KQQ0_TRICU|nr:hypothetical protein TNCT_390131 [Trichonephila clavata]GFQ65654.1 hypothetical protein TNCT_319921 [Trichonephila clavata]GFQ74501.1 hypothetical protein TNCT_620191 [Trichonephila clavata]GFQ78718.1 hypothetical protein TNCT_350381 [Trichonephila clavata]GFQ80886.1 hypothetical protein TNCT_202271 [Trichonephila clavata]